MTTLKSCLFVLFLIVHQSDSLFAQDKPSPLLIAIEDSVRGKLIPQNDSAWINSQLIFQQKSKNKEICYYKLTHINHKKFIEGPHTILFDSLSKDSLSNTISHYGDDFLKITGLKVYTYIGNSSRGYYYEYHLTKLTPLNETIKIDSSIEFKIPKENTCEHGWDQNRSLACSRCLHNYRMSMDSTLKPYSHYHPSFRPMSKDSISSITINIPVDTSTPIVLSFPEANSGIHHHDCCSVACHACKNFPNQRARRKFLRKRKRIERKARKKIRHLKRKS